MAPLLMGIFEEHGYVQLLKESSEVAASGGARHGAYGYELHF
jgi:hypothetical protein